MFDKTLGIDLGSSNTVIYMKEKGIVLREPSIVAVDVKSNSVLAVGNEAKEMFGRTPGSLVAVKPLSNGIISDIDITASMLKSFIAKVLKLGMFSRPKAVICIEQSATEVERRALNEAASKAGISEVKLLEEPLAAAMGAGLDISYPNGSMIVDIGAGSCEAAVLSLGDIVTSCHSNMAGNKMDEYIISYLKRKYRLVIGQSTAEEIKISIGSAYPYEDEGQLQIKGRSLFEGLPKNIVISSKEIREAIEFPLSSIIETILNTVEKTPPELVSDVIKNGIMLTGGTSLLRGIDYFIAKTVGVKTFVAANVFDCVAVGTGMFIESSYKTKSNSFQAEIKATSSSTESAQLSEA